jgi:hypothetical protein
LPEFVAGDLSGTLAGDLRAHLRACPACRIEAAGHLQARKALLAAAAARQAGWEAGHGAGLHAALHQDILRAVAAAPAAPLLAGAELEPPASWARRLRWWWSGGLLGAAAWLLAGFLVGPPSAANPGRSLVRPPLVATAGFAPGAVGLAPAAFQPELGPGGWPMGLELLGHEVSAGEAADRLGALRLEPLVEEWERDLDFAAGRGPQGVWRKWPMAK